MLYSAQFNVTVLARRASDGATYCFSLIYLRALAWRACCMGVPRD